MSRHTRELDYQAIRVIHDVPNPRQVGCIWRGSWERSWGWSCTEGRRLQIFSSAHHCHTVAEYPDPAVESPPHLFNMDLWTTTSLRIVFLYFITFFFFFTIKKINWITYVRTVRYTHQHFNTKTIPIQKYTVPYAYVRFLRKLEKEEVGPTGCMEGQTDVKSEIFI